MFSNQMTFDQFESAYNAKKVDVANNLPYHEVIERIWRHEKTVRGIDWRAAAAGGPDTLAAAVAKAQAWLDGQARALSAAEVKVAQDLGVLSKEGKPIELAAFLRDAVGGAPVPATFPDGAPSYTVWGWSSDTVAKYQAARGNDVATYVTNLVNNFQVMEQDDEVGITKICMQSGVIAFGAAAIKYVLNIIKTLVTLTEATEASAVFSGILSVGANVIRFMISSIVLAILVPLMILMAKDAFGLFVIINNTDSDLVMSDIVFTHGKCVSGFKADADADNPQAIIPAKFVIENLNVQTSYAAISAGFLGVRKRDNALVGTQGAISFASTSEFASGIFLGWEVPLSIGSNRLLVSANFTGSVDDFSNQTDDSGALDSTDTSPAGHVIEGHMNADGGSSAYAFVIAS
ncbi:hypothetical protein DK419_08890 [Methylobacterium terrae]|uniref:Uncharacterized protein n=1 Tax=Methylobacterium terrae TaxID=2202827 RepID=A0A2U8WLI2_9HYPH|nr:hypothetical protein [Methylobacterium terrae]AWN46418.1 hypothetical protein DK419_08890 [Methylobacterium terrae]